MIELELQLKRHDRSRRPPAAVLLRGDDARAWLKELANARVPQDQVRLLPLASGRDAPLIGVVCPVSEAEAERFSADTPRYGAVADRLFVPVEAGFDPPVAESEWDELLPDDGSLWVWHPQLGLVRFEPDQQLQAVTLFRPLSSRSTDWGRACTGVAEPPRLMSLRADILPTIAEILNAGQDDIGEDADERFTQPPSEDDRSGLNPAQRMMSASFQSLASMMGWIRSQLPESEQGTDFYDKAVRWLNQMAAMTPKIEREREREIRRLLDKLKSDPDEGLKFALPMSGMPGRGVAPPGSRLTQRNVDYRRGHGGGGPVDAWSIDYELQQQLLQQYRAACEREVALGRFRRAAYIHAELLGDFHAAAKVLEQGRHYHEAAAVYRDQLARPLDAARCLERGGLLLDAIEIYQELNELETVGELYLRLEDGESARDAFEQAVTRHLEQGDRLKAADLLRSRLDDTERALGVLRDGWPGSGQARRCLESHFEILGEIGEHDRARRAVDDVSSTTVSLNVQAALAGILSELSGRYPDVTVRDHAADVTRRLASRHIEESGAVAREILRAVARLAPEDRLLERDCRRFRLPQKSQPLIARSAATRRPGRRGRLLRQIALPHGYHWLSAESVGSHVYLAGHDGDQTLILVRVALSGDSDRSLKSVTWQGRGSVQADAPVLMKFARQPHPVVRILRFGCPALPSRTLPETDDFPEKVTAVAPGWLADDHIGLASAGMHSWTLDARYVLSRHSPDGVITASFPLEYEGELHDVATPWVTVPVPMHARSGSVSVALGSQFFRVSNERRPLQTLRFSGRITGISGSARHTRERILVTHEAGASLLFPSGSGLGKSVLEEQTTDLRGTFLKDGHVILWSPGPGGETELRQYSTSNGHCELLGMTSVSGDSDPFPLTLLPTNEPAECAVIPAESGIPIRVWGFDSE